MKTLKLADLKKMGFVKAIERPLEIIKCQLAADAAAALNAPSNVPGTLFIVMKDGWVSQSGKPHDKGTGFFIAD